MNTNTKNRFPLNSARIWKLTILDTIKYAALLSVGSFLLKIIFDSIDKKVNALFFTILISLFLLIFLLVYLYQKWSNNFYEYDLTEDYIKIKKSPISPQEISVAYKTITDVTVYQDIIDQVFNLYNIQISTPSISSTIDAYIDGLKEESAEGLKNEILAKIQQKNSI